MRTEDANNSESRPNDRDPVLIRETAVFNWEHPIYKALDAMGYMPPKCTGARIDLDAYEVPTITVTAWASTELAKWILDLGKADIRVEVVDDMAERYGLTLDEAEAALRLAAEKK